MLIGPSFRSRTPGLLNLDTHAQTPQPSTPAEYTLTGQPVTRQANR
jgi:hypothetical protein